MISRVYDNNQVKVAGKAVSGLRYSHDMYGEGFYFLDLAVERLSKNRDIIPLMVNERLIDVTKDYRETHIEINGQFHSYSCHEKNKTKLILYVFVREITIYETCQDVLNTNFIFLDGYVCKAPIYRKTPLGRDISDLLLAVNRPNGKSDYIPCISWGRNAILTGKFPIGSHLQIWGMIQSREYQKRITDSKAERRTAYEVSISKLINLE